MRIVKLVPDKAASIKAVKDLKPRVHSVFKQSTDPKKVSLTSGIPRGGFGVFNRPPPEILKISAESSIA